VDKPSHKQLVHSIRMFIVMLPLSVVEHPSFLDEDQLLILHVFLEHLANHQDIIKADDTLVPCEAREHIFHPVLEGGWGIAEAEGHHPCPMINAWPSHSKHVYW